MCNNSMTYTADEPTYSCDSNGYIIIIQTLNMQFHYLHDLSLINKLTINHMPTHELMRLDYN